MSKWTNLEYELLKTSEWYLLSESPVKFRFMDGLLFLKARKLPVFHKKIDPEDVVYSHIEDDGVIYRLCRQKYRIEVSGG